MIQLDLETLLMSELDGMDIPEVGIVWVDIQGMVSRFGQVVVEAGGTGIDTVPRLSFAPVLVDVDMQVFTIQSTALPVGEVQSSGLTYDTVRSETVGLTRVDTTVQPREV